MYCKNVIPGENVYYVYNGLISVAYKLFLQITKDNSI